MKRGILNVATGTSWYQRGQSRLAKSLMDVGETADALFWRDCYPPYSPTHQRTPYAFKAWAFAYALMSRYEQALWLDSSCIVTRPLDEVWEALDTKGYVLGLEGWTVGEWCNDNALELMGLTREEALEIPLMEGKIIGFDLRYARAKDFLSQWISYAGAGAFNGSWDDHRHDITVGAVIAHRLQMSLTPGLVSLTKQPALIHASGI